MTPVVDVNTVYPLGVVLFVVFVFLAQLKYFATTKDLLELEKNMAEKYCQKEDVRLVLDEIKSAVKHLAERFDEFVMRK